MKKIYISMSSILAAFTIPMVSLVSCKEEEKPEPGPKSISIVQGDTIAYVGYNRQLTYTIAYNAAAEEVGWESSVTGVAEVNANGEITPKAEGKTTIKVWLVNNPEISDECELTVYEAKPLCFTDVSEDGEGSSISYLTWKDTSLDIHIQYSYDQNDWQDWDKNTPINLTSGKSIYVQNTSGTLSNADNWFYFKMEGKIKASGYVDSMVNYSELTPYCYNSMFFQCTPLTTAPEFPATSLANNCYEEMFWSCDSLTKTPKLPAKSLVNGCYYMMFAYCDNLLQVTELQATTLASYCYYSMFFWCQKLRIKDEQGQPSNKIFTCPNSLPDSAVEDMFDQTVGEFKGTPQEGHTYYWYAE